MTDRELMLRALRLLMVQIVQGGVFTPNKEEARDLVKKIDGVLAKGEPKLLDEM